MKATLTILILIFLTFFSYAETEGTKLIYTTKMSDMLRINTDKGDYLKLGTFLREERAKSKNVMFLSGGDFLAPSAMSSFDHGVHTIDIMNSLAPDAVAINEREFAYKEDEFVLRVSEAAFPFVSSNITDPLVSGNLEGVEDSVCYNYGKDKVCVISLLDPAVIVRYMPDRIRVDSDLNKLYLKAGALRRAGADIVVLLAGYRPDGIEKVYDNGVDVILHSTSKMDNIEYVDGKPLVSVGTLDNLVAVVDILKKPDGSYSYNAELKDISGLKPDPAIQSKLKFYEDKLSLIMSVEIGDLETAVNTEKSAVRTVESAFGNLVADALKEYYGADLGVVNGGGIRGNRKYAAGTKLTRKDIQSELPFWNLAVVIKVSGEQIRLAMENSLSKIEDAKGRFLQVSGMKMTYCPSKPVGQRVSEIIVDGKQVRPNDEFMLALPDFLAAGGDGFDMLVSGKVVKTQKANLRLWEIVREYIEERKSISPVIEGRLVVDCK